MRPRSTSSRHSAPSRICRRHARHASRPSISGSPCARRSSPSGDLGVHPGVAARGGGPCGSPRRPASAGTGLCSCCHDPFLASWARMTRPSLPASAPWRSPWPAGMASCTRWRTSSSASPTTPRATIVGRSTASGRRWRPSMGRGATSASGRLPARRVLPCLARLVPCRAGHVRRGQGPRGRRTADCRGGCSIPRA